jgi:hypothetical protein
LSGRSNTPTIGAKSGEKVPFDPSNIVTAIRRHLDREEQHRHGHSQAFGPRGRQPSVNQGKSVRRSLSGRSNTPTIGAKSGEKVPFDVACRCGDQRRSSAIKGGVPSFRAAPCSLVKRATFSRQSMAGTCNVQSTPAAALNRRALTRRPGPRLSAAARRLRCIRQRLHIQHVGLSLFACHCAQEGYAAVGPSALAPLYHSRPYECSCSSSICSGALVRSAPLQSLPL